MGSKAGAVAVTVEGKRLTLSRLEKVFYPATGFTKGEVLDYYVRAASALLPHLGGRPITLKRYPNGVDGEFFYQKECPLPRPDWMRTSEVWSEHRGAAIRYCVVDDLPSLVWLVNLADLEFHAFLHKADDVTRPTAVAFDLDPGEGAGLVDCSRVALLLRRSLARDGLASFPKTSGQKGMQVYVPLNTRPTYDQTKSYARDVAMRLEQEHPDHITSIMRKDARVERVFIDWSQNDEHKTTICAYSLRATPRPGVSTPLAWSEVEIVARRGRDERLRFTPQAVLDRIRRFGDRFKGALTRRQRLPREKQPPKAAPRAASLRRAGARPRRAAQ